MDKQELFKVLEKYIDKDTIEDKLQLVSEDFLSSLHKHGANQVEGLIILGNLYDLYKKTLHKSLEEEN